VAARRGAVTRLSRAALKQVGDRDVRMPPPPELASGVGIVHLGIGAFHRAHQAVFTEDAAVSSGQGGWGICGVTQRSAKVVEQLRPQDCLYTVLERGTDRTTARVVAQVSDVLFAREEESRLLSLFADPAVRVVTLTVTEKGYRRNAFGGLDLHDAAVAADLQGGCSTTVGQIVRGLQARQRAESGGITVLSCDNLTENGRVLRRLVSEFCAALPSAEGDALGSWVEANVSFPSSMVDRIVPATAEGDLLDAQSMLGLVDEALVVAEPFRQWVIQDDFIADRPAWDRVGADLVQEVAPFEQLKLRMLNGTHSLLAYLGGLSGYETIAEAVADPELATAAEHLMSDDVLPTLAGTPGLDPARYGQTVLERFANPALRHRTTQVAMDGSQKLPLRLLGTVRDRLAAGAFPEYATTGVAAWMAYVALRRDRRGRALPLDDPLAPRLESAVAGASSSRDVVDGLLGVDEVFGKDLRESERFRSGLEEQVGRIVAETGQPL
jgi:fructuronate reductase